MNDVSTWTVFAWIVGILLFLASVGFAKFIVVDENDFEYHQAETWEKFMFWYFGASLLGIAVTIIWVLAFLIAYGINGGT